MPVVHKKISSGNWNIALKLIGFNVIFFLLQLMFPEFMNQLVLVSSEVLFKPWTLITTTFLHAGLDHLFFNMYALLLFGPLIEQRIGSKRFLTFYIVAGILSSLGFVLFKPIGSAVGASGAIMGVIGLVIILFPNLKVLFFFIIPMTMRTAGIIFAIIDIIGLFNASSGVANIAHLVGLACGLLYGNFLSRKTKDFYNRFSKKKTTYKTKRGSKVHADKDPNKVVIELSDEDVDEYLKNGRL